MNMLVTCTLLLGMLIFTPCVVSLSAGLTCDRTKQYPVRNNKSMKIVKCLNCRECFPGYEPKVPCGKIIGIDDVVGHCRPCPDGTFSPSRDAKACGICQKTRCFKHQRIEGKCERDKYDQSHCLNECEDGYIMNKGKTACHLMNMTTNTGSNIPKSTPAMTNINTTKKLVLSPNQANKKSTGLKPGIIAFIVIGTVVGVGIAIAVLYRCRNWRRANIGDKKDVGGSTSTDVLVDVPAEGTVKSANGPFSPVLPMVKKPSPETMPEFDNATSLDALHLNPNVSCISNERNIPRIAPAPSRNNQMAWDTHVRSPRTAGCGNNREQFLATIFPNPCPYSSDVSRNSNESHPKRLDGKVPYKIIRMICDHFDYEDNWENLAAWLKLTAQEVKRIKNKSFISKTEQIIQIWTTRKENDLQKFLQILETKGMTQLVAEINEEIAACREEYIC